AVVADARLQGHAARLAGRRLLPRSAGRAHRERARARASALFDQHLSVLAVGASVPDGVPQWRDQYAARQRQLDGRAPAFDEVEAAGRRSGEAVAAGPGRTVRYSLLRQRARAA